MACIAAKREWSTVINLVLLCESSPQQGLYMIMTSAICGNHIQILLSELGMLGYPLHYSLHTLTISSSNSVSFPFLEPLICHFVKFLEVRKAAKFLEKSAANIIEARKMKSNVTALVSFHVQISN